MSNVTDGVAKGFGGCLGVALAIVGVIVALAILGSLFGGG
jgi:hypothetical protein